jgi:hypothetical protein
MAGNFRFTVSPRPHLRTTCPTKSARRVVNLVWVKQLQRETGSLPPPVAKVSEYGGWIWCSNTGNGKGKAILIPALTGP